MKKRTFMSKLERTTCISTSNLEQRENLCQNLKKEKIHFNFKPGTKGKSLLKFHLKFGEKAL